MTVLEFKVDQRAALGRTLTLDDRFADITFGLHDQLDRLLAQPARTFESFSETEPQGGVYLFTEHGRHLFAGRTSRLYQRLLNHCRGSTSENRSLLKLSLIVEDTVFLARPMRKAAWSDVSRLPGFTEAFARAKNRVQMMDIRFIEERDDLAQLLLEVYCKAVLKTPNSPHQSM
ncbi:MAG TPA: GIY-YIG nuclease family protein [Caulobacteraceae bacterium]|jgi:hypothetical protein